MTIDNFIEKANEYNLKVAEFKEKARDFVKESFNDIAKQFFKDNPEVQCIFWRQYTPYFNDGEACVFSLREPEFILKGFDKNNLLTYYEEEEGIESVQSIPSDFVFERAKKYETTKNKNDKYYFDYVERFNKQRAGLAEECEKFSKFLQDNEDSFESLFGDHVCVYVLPNEEPIVEEFEHD